MKKKIGKWLQFLGLRLSGENEFYTVPRARTQNKNDFSKCECGHSMHDHQPGAEGHGTVCLACFSLMMHKPSIKSDVLAAEFVN